MKEHNVDGTSLLTPAAVNMLNVVGINGVFYSFHLHFW
jgi:hypothetical protein